MTRRSLCRLSSLPPSSPLSEVATRWCCFSRVAASCSLLRLSSLPCSGAAAGLARRPTLVAALQSAINQLHRLRRLARLHPRLESRLVSHLLTYPEKRKSLVSPDHPLLSDKLACSKWKNLNADQCVGPPVAMPKPPTKRRKVFATPGTPLVDASNLGDRSADQHPSDALPSVASTSVVDNGTLKVVTRRLAVPVPGSVAGYLLADLCLPSLTVAPTLTTITGVLSDIRSIPPPPTQRQSRSKGTKHGRRDDSHPACSPCRRRRRTLR